MVMSMINLCMSSNTIRKCRYLSRILQTLVADPRAIGCILNDEEVIRKRIIRKFGYEQGLPTLNLVELIPNPAETVYPLSFLSDGSTPTDYLLLNSLAKKYDHCRYLEIGTWRGESIANVAQFAEECYSISLPKEDLIKRGFSEKMVKTLGFFSEKLENVVHIGADSTVFDFDSLDKKFDIIFIDGDHSAHAIASDTRNAFKLLRDENSVIVWHDYGYTPEHIRWETLEGIMEGCPPQWRNNIYHVSNTLCAIFIRGQFNSKICTFPEVPDKVFKLDVSIEKINTVGSERI